MRVFHASKQNVHPLIRYPRRSFRLQTQSLLPSATSKTSQYSLQSTFLTNHANRVPAANIAHEGIAIVIDEHVVSFVGFPLGDGLNDSFPAHPPSWDASTK